MKPPFTSSIRACSRVASSGDRAGSIPRVAFRRPAEVHHAALGAVRSADGAQHLRPRRSALRRKSRCLRGAGIRQRLHGWWTALYALAHSGGMFTDARRRGSGKNLTIMLALPSSAICFSCPYRQSSPAAASTRYGSTTNATHISEHREWTCGHRCRRTSLRSHRSPLPSSVQRERVAQRDGAAR